ncbi:mitochondrial substrate carrier [Volvox carteri f. nagariensis]|uniref:Mitochondrial substrate carrier n=1 Tax=Volvox carteri f. nagariensis TaxID=3068 RepID=D8TJD8_VOLCA|nr:mitochondrial substrate carrier [Volvox carteri f. nagariensis]EFJ52525.1 mitochondrial substrate carrier [Volvox carteri f. nagariensis]|eukprot:XP_002946598.1 mitochondrial substrate carrier [Volvox carteri f. nagariensis]
MPGRLRCASTRQGHITEKDLETYATRNGLPASYVAPFVDAVRATAKGGNATVGRSSTSTSSKHQQADAGTEDAEGEEEDAELTFAMFRRFVRSREEALRRAFNLFDQDGDGRISVDDLDASLARVAVCCPKTRCIYRCRTRIAKQLYSKAASEHGYLGLPEFRDFFLLLPQQDMLVEYWVAAGAAPELSDKVSVARTGDGAGAKGSPWGEAGGLGLGVGCGVGGTGDDSADKHRTAPLETLRLAAMAGQLQSRSLVQAASDIVSAQGWRGLYRGNLLNVMRSAPQKALDFFVFDAFKRIIGDDTHLQIFVAAGLAGCTSWVALYPLEVVRSRITVAAAAAAAAAAAGSAAGGTASCLASPSPHRAVPGLAEALGSIVRREGVGALYRGLGPSVAAIFPEAAITYGLHDALKKAYTRIAREEPGVAPSLAAGVLSAFMGQLVSFPLETVSRRLQVAQGAGGLAGAAAVVRGLLREGGPAALGIGAATLRLVPMACVSFGTYEAVRALIVTWEQRCEEQQVKKMLTSRCVPLVLTGPDGGKEVVGRICTPAGSQSPGLCGPGGWTSPKFWREARKGGVTLPVVVQSAMRGRQQLEPTAVAAVAAFPPSGDVDVPGRAPAGKPASRWESGGNVLPVWSLKQWTGGYTGDIAVVLDLQQSVVEADAAAFGQARAATCTGQPWFGAIWGEGPPLTSDHGSQTLDNFCCTV